MNVEALPAAIVFVVVFLIGARSTRRLWATYLAIAPYLRPSRRLLGKAFVIVSVLVMIAIGWFGSLTIRTLLGFERLDWSPVVSYVVSLPVLLIPVLLDYVWARVGQVP